ncbi:MAG: hypothetical protein ABIG55_03045 [Candidatus Omnitrophota bacterium]
MMRKLLAVFICFAVYLTGTSVSYGDGYETFAIKQGLHKRYVNKKYGVPLLEEKLRSGFLPIPKEKALYKIDDSTYMILYFFSGRIHEITILDDITYEDAAAMFMSGNEKNIERS